MKKTRIAGAIGALCLAGVMMPGLAMAQYPNREITMIVPFGAGGSTDIIGRIAAQALSKRLGVPVVVDNRGGAGGTVGTQAAAGAKPDGYTITVATTSTHVVGPLTVKTKYDPVKDFTHIGMIAETPYVMVINPQLKATSVQEVIDLARKEPGKLNYGSAGQGSTTHLAGLMFLNATKTDMEHIPYDSNAKATAALMGNEVQVLFGSMPAVLAQIQANSIKALAVGTTTRSPKLKDTPTLQEAGVKDYRASLWLGLSAPAGTPPEVVKKLADALGESIADPAVGELLEKNGADPTKMSPQEFSALIASEIEVYGAIVKGMKK